MATTEVHDDAGLRGFLNRGGFWPLVVVLIAYLAVYVGGGSLVGELGGHYKDDDVLTSVGSIFFQVTAGLIIGAIVLLAFTTYMGWNRELFGRQPIYRSWWMWIGPLIVLTPIVLRVFGIDWGRHGFDVVAFMLVSGLMIGFVEELMFRGIGVKMLRDGGHGEWAVAALSSLLFALSHSINLISGQSIKTVGPTVIYTFAFGVLMYLSLRSIGFLVGAMILHGLTDPTTILATGGVDKMTDRVSSEGLLTAAGVFTFLLIVAGYILLIFIRGKVADRGSPAAVPAT